MANFRVRNKIHTRFITFILLPLMRAQYSATQISCLHYPYMFSSKRDTVLSVCFLFNLFVHFYALKLRTPLHILRG